MSIQRPPPFTPQQRIDNAFENYPNATLDAMTRKIMQNPGFSYMAEALRGPQNPLFAVSPQHLQHMAGDVIPMPGMSPNRVPFTPSAAQVSYGRDVAPYLAGTNVLRFPLTPSIPALTNIYQQNMPYK